MTKSDSQTNPKRTMHLIDCKQVDLLKMMNQLNGHLNLHSRQRCPHLNHISNHNFTHNFTHNSTHNSTHNFTHNSNHTSNATSQPESERACLQKHPKKPLNDRRPGSEQPSNRQSNRRFNYLDHRIHHIKLLFFAYVFICLISLNDSARVYKGKKHTTNSPIYFISAPFLPNRPVNNLPPPAPRPPQLSHPANILPSVYNNLAIPASSSSATTKSPLSAVTRPYQAPSLNQPPANAVFGAIPNADSKSDQSSSLKASITSFLLKSQANPNSIVNRFNASALPTADQVVRIKLKRKKSPKSPNTSQPVRTINVNFSLNDLKKTFGNFKPPTMQLPVKSIQPVKMGDERMLSDMPAVPDNSSSSNRLQYSPNQSALPEPAIAVLPPVAPPAVSASRAPPDKLMDRSDRAESVTSESSAKQSESSTMREPFKTGDRSLNLLGEIILNSLQSKLHNFHNLKFLSNGQPSQVLLGKQFILLFVRISDIR